MEKSGQEEDGLKNSPTESKAVDMILPPETPSEEIVEERVVVGGLLKASESHRDKIDGSTFEDWPVIDEQSFEASSGPEV
jgi:hypothetical protein